MLLSAGRHQEALLTFELNRALFRYNPVVYDSFGEALMEMGEKEKAIQMYEKVLSLDPEMESALKDAKRFGPAKPARG